MARSIEVTVQYITVLLAHPTTPVTALTSMCRRHGPASRDGQEESVMLDLVARMLDYDPERRMTLKEALKHPFFDRLSVFQKLEEVSKHILRLQI